MKTVTDIRQSSARDTFIAESVYLVLKWEPVEKLKQRWSVLRFFQYEASSTVGYATRLWTEEAGRPERRELQ